MPVGELIWLVIIVFAAGAFTGYCLGDVAAMRRMTRWMRQDRESIFPPLTREPPPMPSVKPPKPEPPMGFDRWE